MSRSAVVGESLYRATAWHGEMNVIVMIRLEQPEVHYLGV